MEFKGKELNKWFTRVRKRLGGPPGFKRQDARTYWNCQREVELGIGIIHCSKVYCNDGMAIGLSAWVVYEFDMADHWRNYFMMPNREGFILEKEAEFTQEECHSQPPSERWAEIYPSNCEEMEGVFAGLYEKQLKPWLDGFETPADVFDYIKKNFCYREVLPLRFDPEKIDFFRAEVGRLFIDYPDRERNDFADWLERKDIVSAEEALEIKTASYQHIDHVKERMQRLGEAMMRTA